MERNSKGNKRGCIKPDERTVLRIESEEDIMRYYETKIGKIIEEEFDSRMGNAVFAYIMSNGIDAIKEYTDEEITKIKGNVLCTAEFNQSLVRCARRICRECEWIEMIEFIRLYLWCTPTVHDVYLYREDFTEETFAELLNSLDLEDEDVGSEIKLFAVVDKE